MGKLLTISLFFIILPLTVMAQSEYYFSAPEPVERIEDAELSELISRENAGESSVSLFYTIAKKYAGRGNYQLAKAYLHKAIALSEDNAFLWGELGMIELRTGKEDSALAHFEKTLELNYDYIDIWKEIVKLDPQYYFNLGMLYKEKAEKYKSVELAEKGIEHLNNYIDKMPRGGMMKEASSARNELELFITELQARERREAYQQKILEEERRQQQALAMSIEEFRTTRPHLLKLNLNSFHPFQSFTFKAENPDDVVDDSVSIKPSISEFTFTGSLIKGPIIAGGFIGWGTAAVDKQFTKEYNERYPPEDPRYQVKGSLSSLSSFRVGAECLYNFYYKPPLLLIMGISGDYAVFTPKEKEDIFQSISGFQVCWQLGVYFSFQNFIGELGYNLGLLGNKRGGTIKVGIGYKI